MDARMGLNDNKAGMQGLDKEKINKIIMEATKGSRFYENELKKDQQVNQRIEKMMQLKEKITTQQLLKAQLQVDKLVAELEQSRNLSSTIVHIDMDAFYAAVEMRDNPELKEKPVAVGSMSMLSTSNYHARRFGVRAAMPGFIAKKLCPHLTIVPLNFEKYGKVSKEVREILAEYDPNFMPMGLDEAYLNITEHLEERLNWPEDRRRFYLNTESTTGADKDDMNMSDKFNESECSSSPVLFEDNTSHLKQRGQSVENSVVFGTSAEEVVKEIRFRIEQKTQLTASAGIAPNTMLAKMCSDCNKPNGQYRITPERQAVLDFLKDLPIRKGKTVTLKLKNVNFEVKTRASTVLSSVSTEEEIFAVAKDLLGTEIDSVAPHPLRIRLMGVRVSGFLSEEEKKYQQKSIMSFLKSGKEIGFLRLQPEKSNQEYFTKSSEASHRGSFFDQKRATRLLNSESLAPNGAVGKQLFHHQKSSADFVEETKKVTGLQSSSVCKIFTCPVCFEEQSSNNLEELNRHIDECLNGTFVKDTVERSKNDRSREDTLNSLPQFKNENIDECQKNKIDQLATTDQSASTSDSFTNNSAEKFAQIISDKSHREQQPSNLSDIARNVCMKQCLFPKRKSQGNEDQFEKTERTEGTSISCFFEAKEDSVLVCPICNTEQKTTSLVSFNRHVDICLNKGLIQELTEKKDFPTENYNMENWNRVVLPDEREFQYAAKMNNLETMEKLFKKNVNLNAVDTLNRTAFHFAVAGGHVSVVDFLLHHKARLDISDQKGKKPFLLASEKGHVDMINNLISLKLFTSEKDKRDIALMVIEIEDGNVGIKATTNFHVPNQEGNTALHLAAKNGHSEVVKILLEQWEEINDLNQNGETAFYLSVEGGHEKCAELLLDAGSDMNVLTQNNSSALQVAVQNGHLSLVTFLIDKNIDLVPKPERQETPLHLAADLGNVELVEVLLKAGCDLKTMDKHGKTALAVASRSNHALIVDMIIKAERYYTMTQTHPAHNDDVSDFSVSFKQDHSTQTKQIRSSLWNLAYNQLKPCEWKKLAIFWKFTDEQIKAIEEQWTGKKSYKEHGNRMLLIWLHGMLLAHQNPVKHLYEDLVAAGFQPLAEKIRASISAGMDSRKCAVS
ncbi:Ankyrin repeat and death domain-containing protein 1B [Pitangus sulphuratus]|nr:Ankyrin repeat and death domain-containing protein 1B [Pitangus sulphuratus]